MSTNTSAAFGGLMAGLVLSQLAHVSLAEDQRLVYDALG